MSGGGGGGGGGALREILARFGFEVDDGKLKQADNVLGGLIHKAQSFGAVIASGAFMVTLRHWVTETAAAGKEIRNSAIALGVSTEQLQQWRAVAERAGVEASALSMGLGLLQRKAFDAATQGGEGARVFKRLGVDLRDAAGEVKDPATLFSEVGFAIAAIESPTERTATALDVFGRAGRQFVPIFAQGRERVAEMMAEIGELGAMLTDEQLASLKEYSGAMHGVHLAWEGFKNQIVFAVLPVFTWVAEKMEHASVLFVKLTKGTHVAKIAMVALGAVALATAIKTVAAFAGPLLIVGLIAAGIAAIVLIVDDVITTFEGGDSMIRRFIDGLFGVGATAGVVEVLRLAWNSFYDSVTAWWSNLVAGGWSTAFALGAALTWPLDAARQGFTSLGQVVAALWAQINVTKADIEAALTQAIVAPVTAAWNGLHDLLALISSITGLHGAGVLGRVEISGSSSVRAPRPTQVAQRNQTNVIVNAGAAGAQEVAAEVERRIGDANIRNVQAAAAATPNWSGDL